MESVTNKILHKYDAETTDLLDALLEIFEAYDSKKTAEKFKKTCLQIVFQTVLLYKQKVILKENFYSIKNSFRYVCSSTTNAFRYGNFNDATVVRIAGHVKQFEKDFLTLLGDHAPEKLKKKIRWTATLIGNPEFLSFSYKHPRFKHVVFTLVHYLEITR